MANKKTIPQLELELVRLHRRLTMTVKNIDERRALIKKIRMGKIKQPPPKGKKVMLHLPSSPISKEAREALLNWAEEGDDPPSF